MTAIRLYFVTCNGCARRAGIGFRTITDARNDALMRGWTYLQPRSHGRGKGKTPGADLCPPCLKTRERP